MRLLLIGGSNTVMRYGYVKDLEEYLRSELGRDNVEIENMAVGASPSVFGMQLLLDRTDWDYDVFLVEYMVNDYSLTGNFRRMATWRAAYEGIIRQILTHRPDATIVSLLFGRRSEVAEERLAPMFAEVEAMSEHYGTFVIDAHSYLMSRYSDREVARAELFKADGTHYRRPIATALIGVLTGSRLLRILDQGGRQRSDLPERLAKRTFEKNSVIDFTTIDDVGTPLTFENSRYTVPTRKLTVDTPWRATIPGTVVSVAFVAAVGSSRLLIREAGEDPIAIDTYWTGVRDEKYKFGLLCTALSHRKWSPDRAEPRDVIFEVVPREDIETTASAYFRRHSLIPPAAEREEAAVYLTSAMIFGR
jgi:hypothetical protein